MKGTLRFMGGAALLGALVATTDARGACNPVKSFYTAFGPGENSLLVFPPVADGTIGGPNLKGRFWSAPRAAHSEGTGCPEDRYLFDLGGGQLAVYGALGGDVLGTGACDNAGCPTGELFIVIETRSLDGRAYLTAGYVAETDGSFDFSAIEPGENWVLEEAPRPHVTSVVSDGMNRVLNIHIDAPSPFVHATGLLPEQVITGYQVHAFHGTLDPGRDPGPWGAPIQTLPATAAGADASITFNCNDGEVFFAVRTVFQNGQHVSEYVSRSVNTCESILAEPRYEPIRGRRPVTPPRTPPDRR